jgi:hypothetical protein
MLAPQTAKVSKLSVKLTCGLHFGLRDRAAQIAIPETLFYVAKGVFGRVGRKVKAIRDVCNKLEIRETTENVISEL